MNVFEAARSISAFEVAERYAHIIPVKTGRRSVCRCPFPEHEDKHPSCTFTNYGKYAGQFICTCGHKGNSIDFVSQYMNMKPLDAASLICADFGLSGDKTETIQTQISKTEFHDAICKMDTAIVKASMLCELWLEQCKIHGYDVYETLVENGTIQQSDELEQGLDSVRDEILLQRNQIAALRDELFEARQNDDRESLKRLLLENASWARRAIDAIRANKREISHYMTTN